MRKKIERTVLQVAEDLGLQEDKHNWKLVREHDSLTHTSERISWIEWGENKRGKAMHDVPSVGHSLVMSPFTIYFTWQTTPVTEILYAESDGSLRFRTENSVYTLTRINNGQAEEGGNH